MPKSELEKSRHAIEDYAYGYNMSMGFLEDLLDEYATQVRKSLASEILARQANSGLLLEALEAIVTNG